MKRAWRASASIRRSWDLFLSSGEVAWRLLRRRRPFERPKRCLVLSRATATPRPSTGSASPRRPRRGCRLVLIAGSEAPSVGLDDYAALLARPAGARRAGALRQSGHDDARTEAAIAFGAGRIARLYERSAAR